MRVVPSLMGLVFGSEGVVVGIDVLFHQGILSVTYPQKTDRFHHQLQPTRSTLTTTDQRSEPGHGSRPIDPPPASHFIVGEGDAATVDSKL